VGGVNEKMEGKRVFSSIEEANAFIQQFEIRTCCSHILLSREKGFLKTGN